MDLSWLRPEFDRCWPWLEKAALRLDEGCRHEYVWGRIEDGSAQLWPGKTAAMVTEIVTQQDGGKVIVCWLAGGDMEEIKKLKVQAEQFGRQRNCFKSRITARPGFARRPPDDDYKLVAVIMEKELN